MKDKKSLNKLLYGITLICSSIVFIYAIVAGLILAEGETAPWNLNGAISGTVLLFLIFATAAIIVKMVMVTVPTFKKGSNKGMALSALIVDAIALLGVVFLVCAFIMGNIEPSGEQSWTVPVVLCILLGAPFLFVGEMVAYKLEKSAL